MQPAEVVLSVLRERGRKGLPCTQLYRQMFNRDLYLLAYGNIYSNAGAMTPGASEETADGMSEEKIEQITGLMRREKYRFSQARRVYIPKKNGKLRPLGMPSWSGKLVGEVVRLLLEAYYEPQFSDNSHGFRRERGCHTALRKIDDTWTGTTWFIEGDISDCFGSLDHEILLGILAEEIHDQRFLRLIRNMLKAGYLVFRTFGLGKAPSAVSFGARVEDEGVVDAFFGGAGLGAERGRQLGLRCTGRCWPGRSRWPIGRLSPGSAGAGSARARGSRAGDRKRSQNRPRWRTMGSPRWGQPRLTWAMIRRVTAVRVCGSGVSGTLSMMAERRHGAGAACFAPPGNRQGTNGKKR